MRRDALILFSACAFAASAPAFASDQGGQIDYETARDERRLIVVRAAGTVALDGVLDEPAWAPAPVARNFIQNDPNEGAAATYNARHGERTDRIDRAFIATMTCLFAF
jgi:hypothetical protein